MGRRYDRKLTAPAGRRQAVTTRPPVAAAQPQAVIIRPAGPLGRVGPPGPRLDGVDVLRGLAILTVLLNHVNMRLFLAEIPYTAGLPHQLVSTLFWSGQMGVQIFFAVSG